MRAVLWTGAIFIGLTSLMVGIRVAAISLRDENIVRAPRPNSPGNYYFVDLGYVVAMLYCALCLLLGAGLSLALYSGSDERKLLDGSLAFGLFMSALSFSIMLVSTDRTRILPTHKPIYAALAIAWVAVSVATWII